MAKEVDKRFTKAGPAKPPNVITLPGGKVVRTYDFRITKVDADGRPTAFERAEPGTPSDCVLWASDAFMSSELPSNLMRRYEERVNPLLVTQQRDVETTPYEKEPAFVPRFGTCVDCDALLVACTCHAGCPGAMCPKCETPHVVGVT